MVALWNKVKVQQDLNSQRNFSLEQLKKERISERESGLRVLGERLRMRRKREQTTNNTLPLTRSRPLEGSGPCSHPASRAKTFVNPQTACLAAT